jgi:hypothetical protein
VDEVAKIEPMSEAETEPKPKPPWTSGGSDTLATLRRYFPGVLVSLTSP